MSKKALSSSTSARPIPLKSATSVATSANSSWTAGLRCAICDSLVSGQLPDPAYRPRESAEAYEEIWQEDGSPLIITSRKRQEALAIKLDIPVELGMRYGNPSTPDALKRLLDQGVDDLFIIPMYPHYAMSSYETAVVALMNAVSEQKPDIKTTLLPPFYQDPGYIDAMIAPRSPRSKVTTLTS